MKPLVICACLAVFGVAFAQQAAQQTSERPAFEVASVKASDPNPANSILVGMSADPAIVRYTNITLRDCIRGAFRIRDFQIVGPEWMTSARFEIEGRLPKGASSDQIPEMLQSLLAERFKLTTRRDTKETAVYALLVGNGGPKLKPTEVKPENQALVAMGTDGKPRGLVYYGGSSSAVTVTAPSASLRTFVGVTSRFTARPLVDLTGIEGLYDFVLTFAPEVNGGLPGSLPDAGAAAEPAPTVSEAMKKYGLRIESRKMPLEMLVVTHIERTPTDN